VNRTSCLVILALGSALAGCGDRPLFGPRDGGAADDAHVFTPHDAAGPDTGPEPIRDSGTMGMPDAEPPRDTGTMADASIDAGTLPGDGSIRDASITGDGAIGDAGLLDGSFRDAAGDAGPHLGPAPVDLGPTTDLSRAGAYALIGKTGITNVIGTLVSGGHVGVSPVFSPSITGFALVLDSSGQFSTSPSVVPPARVYAADYAVPTPTNLTSAILDMEGAYTDAASRVLPDFLNLVSGHIGGLVLAPGLYQWGGGVDVTLGITFLGGANDVWILQVNNDVDLSAATNMLLAGGAQARNIFWQVAGQVTMHAGSHFEGIILCQTGITMQTGASLHGRALAQTLVALDDDMITAP
jgi:hypothetical protein